MSQSAHLKAKQLYFQDSVSKLSSCFFEIQKELQRLSPSRQKALDSRSGLERESPFCYEAYGSQDSFSVTFGQFISLLSSVNLKPVDLRSSVHRS